jgi:uncharacterized protein
MGNSGGRFIWYELATNDMEAAKAFYASVVGWGTADAPMPGSTYTLFTARDTPVAGLMKLPADAWTTDAASQWLGYVGVDDVDAVAGRVMKLGGTLRVPPTDVPNVSRFSVIADPQKATLALIKGRERAQERPVQPGTPGRVGWHELLASDLENAFAFYSELLGWQKTEMHSGALGTYQQFSAGTGSIGGIFTGPGVPSLWLYYFNVDGIEAAAKRVKEGGGQVFYGPITVSGGARVVHYTDPHGAIFALIDWPIRIAVGCYSPRDPSDRPARKRPG